MVMNGTLSGFLISGLFSFKVSFLGIDSPYLFYIEKFTTQFKRIEKNNRSPYSFSRKWRFTFMARSSRKEKAAIF